MSEALRKEAGNALDVLIEVDKELRKGNNKRRVSLDTWSKLIVQATMLGAAIGMHDAVELHKGNQP